MYVYTNVSSMLVLGSRGDCSLLFKKFRSLGCPLVLIEVSVLVANVSKSLLNFSIS